MLNDQDPEIGLIDTPANYTPVVCVIGYYGSVLDMNAANYDVMQRVVEECIVDDFKLNINSVAWLCTGGVWPAHIPCTLWRKYSDGLKNKGLVVLPFTWNDWKKANSRYSSAADKKTVVDKLKESHLCFLRRLREQDPQIEDTRQELDRMVQAGCGVIDSHSKSEQQENILNHCTHLIYMPWSKDDDNYLHGFKIYSDAQCYKRIIPLDMLFAKQ